MIEFYLDSADLTEIAKLNQWLPLKGVTTNPSILAKSGIGLTELLPKLSELLGSDAIFYAQVVSETADDMVDEAIQLNKLPYHMVIKVPTTQAGLTAIRKIKQKEIKVLATAIYSTQQGFLAALCGADYLAPYVNRMDAIGTDGVQVVADLQALLNIHEMQSKIIAASFKNMQQAMAVIKLGIGGITLPPDVTMQLINHPAVPNAVAQFTTDWQATFGDKRSFES